MKDRRTLPDHHTMLRFMHLAEAYREAFEMVQDLLETRDTGKVPQWVFAIHTMDLQDVAKIDVDLARAEKYRRSVRVALHAFAESMALDTGMDEAVDPDVEQLIDSLSPDADPPEHTVDRAGQKRLDGFISIMNYARTGNVIFVNGTFDPIARPVSRSVTQATNPLGDEETTEVLPSEDD